MKKRLLIAVVLLIMCTITTGCQIQKSDDAAQEGETSVTVDEEENTMKPDVATDATDVEEDENTTSIYEGKTSLTYIGHASVKIVAKDGTVIYVDPNYEDEYVDKADYVLVTHSHDDHRPHPNVKLKDTGKLITYKDSLHDGIYESYDFENIQIETVAAGGNPNHSIKNCVGYIITVDGIKIYHAGDTSMIEQMALLTEKEIDYAMYPIDGIYNMDAVEATEVANLVAAKNNIPIHEYDSGDTKKSDQFTPDGKKILEYGETIIIGE